MAQPELIFQKDMVRSAIKAGAMSEITTHRFKKGWPDLYWKFPGLPAIHVECKYYDISKRRSAFDPVVPVELTELQRICLKKMRAFNTIVGTMIKVTIDKRAPRVYTVYDLDAKHITMHDWPVNMQARWWPDEGDSKLWPIAGMTKDLIANLPI